MVLKMKLGIIIINWNRIKDTIECLESIRYYNKYLNSLIIVVDNFSNEAINQLYEYETNKEINLEIIVNKNNYGFAKANNIGVQYAIENDCEYILLLNNDTILVEDSFSRLIDLYNENEYGVIGLVNYHYPSNNKIWQAGWKINRTTSKLNHVNQIPGFDGIVDVDFIPGSSIFTTSKVIASTGLFDENYFAYWEDADFCLKVKNKGYKVGFVNNSKLLHKVGQSSPSGVQEYFFHRNRLYFFNKYSTNFIRSYFNILLNSTAKLILQMFHLNFKNAKAIFYGIFDYHKGNMAEGSITKVK